MQTAIKTQPAIEPILTAEACDHLRVEHAADNALIDGLIKASRQACERFTGRQIVSATWYRYMDQWPVSEIQLPYPPLTSVSSIKYNDLNGDQQTWTAASYDEDINSEPGRIAPAYGEDWPSARVETQSIVIEYVCGWADETAVPEAIKQGMKIWIGNYYRFREPPPKGSFLDDCVAALWTPYITAEPVDL